MNILPKQWLAYLPKDFTDEEKRFMTSIRHLVLKAIGLAVKSDVHLKSDQLLLVMKNIFVLFYKTSHLNEEVKYNEPFLSVSISRTLSLSFFSLDEEVNCNEHSFPFRQCSLF